MAKKTVAKKKAGAGKSSASGKKVSKAASKKKASVKKAGTTAAKKKTTKKATKKSAKSSLPPKPINSGKGATPRELGNKVLAMINAQAPLDSIWAECFHKNFESIEGGGMVWTGVKAVAAKCQEWDSTNTTHEFKATGPFVGATGFAIQYEMDVENKQTGERTKFAEVGVYTVKNGKIVREEFMYGSDVGC
jgi:hypothetical protein